MAESEMWDPKDCSAELSNDDFYCKNDKLEDDDCPTIWVFKPEKHLMRRPWQSTLIIKLLDHSIEFSYLQKRLPQLLALKLPFDFINLVNGFFMV